MPGRLLTPQIAAFGSEIGLSTIMGVYKLTIPEVIQESLNPSARNDSSSFKTQWQQPILRDYRNSGAPPPSPRRPSRASKTSFEHAAAPSDQQLEKLMMSDQDDGNSSDVFTTSSTRNSRDTISDDDSILMEFASRASSIDDVFFVQAPKRHSTACCSDMAFRREQRKKLMHVEPTVDEQAGLQLRNTSSLAMNWSFRRELEAEDEGVDESLALWEETVPGDGIQPVTRSRNVVNNNIHPAPNSWHAGDTASSRNYKKKSTSSFFNGLFSGLNLSTSRIRFRKSST